MSFWDELQADYTDQFGLVAPNTSRQSTNGVCYTGEAMVVGSLIGEMPDTRKASWLALMATVEIVPGLIKRTPVDNEEEGPDDYYGYLAGAAIANPATARAFLWYGLKHLGFYNTDGKWAWSDCLWRQPQLITHALFAARLPVGPMRIFFIASLLLAVRQNTPATDAGAPRLAWLLIANWDRKGWLCRYAVKRWSTWLATVFPNGMETVYSDYCGPNHPLAKYCPMEPRLT